MNAEAPKDFVLPLSSIVKPRAGSACTYSKDPFGKVTIYFFVDTVDELDSLGRMSIIATVPEGYKAKQRTYGVFSGHTKDSTKSNSGSLAIAADGVLMADVIGQKLFAISGTITYQA